MEELITIATSLPFGIIVGVLLLSAGIKADRWLNQRFQPDYEEEVDENNNIV